MQDTNPLDRLFADAKAHGVPMSRLCDATGIDPTTPSRWRRGLADPSLSKLLELQAALAKIVGEQAKAA